MDEIKHVMHEGQLKQIHVHDHEARTTYVHMEQVEDKLIKMLYMHAEATYQELASNIVPVFFFYNHSSLHDD